MSVSARARKRSLKVQIFYPVGAWGLHMVCYDVIVRGKVVECSARYTSSTEVLQMEMEDIGCWWRGEEWIAECRSCGRDIPIEDYCTPQEWLEQPRDYDVCGGSPRCLP